CRVVLFMRVVSVENRNRQRQRLLPKVQGGVGDGAVPICGGRATSSAWCQHTGTPHLFDHAGVVAQHLVVDLDVVRVESASHRSTPPQERRRGGGEGRREARIGPWLRVRAAALDRAS